MKTVKTCNALVFDKKWKRHRKCRLTAVIIGGRVQHYCHRHLEKPVKYEYGICYVCNNPCNIYSQTCGICARNGSLFTLD